MRVLTPLEHFSNITNCQNWGRTPYQNMSSWGTLWITVAVSGKKLTPSIQGCCKSSSGVIRWFLSQCKQPSKKLTNKGSLHPIVGPMSLVPGQCFLPHEFGTIFGLLLLSAHPNYSTIIYLSIEIIIWGNQDQWHHFFHSTVAMARLIVTLQKHVECFLRI